MKDYMKQLIFLVCLFSVHNLFAQGNKPFASDVKLNNELFGNPNPSFNNSNLFLKADDTKKSVGLAVVLSLLLPGMGELYAGDYSTGRYSTAAEGALWLTYTSFELYGTWVRDDARKLAVTTADVNLAGQSNQFFVDIGNYKDVYQYNERKLQDRQEEKLYDPNSIYFWSWNSESDRQKYRNLRISSDQAFNNKQFVLGAVLVNHVVSAINAARSVIAYNNKNEILQSINFDTKILGSLDNPQGIVLKISKTF
jgi:hypothetical protein